MSGYDIIVGFLGVIAKAIGHLYVMRKDEARTAGERKQIRDIEKRLTDVFRSILTNSVDLHEARSVILQGRKTVGDTKQLLMVEEFLNKYIQQLPRKAGARKAGGKKAASEPKRDGKKGGEKKTIGKWPTKKASGVKRRAGKPIATKKSR